MEEIIYKGFEICLFCGGYCVCYHGDEDYFDTEEEAKEFIDSITE